MVASNCIDETLSPSDAVTGGCPSRHPTFNELLGDPDSGRLRRGLLVDGPKQVAGTFLQQSDVNAVSHLISFD
jgi:hypothetical protein